MSCYRIPAGDTRIHSRYSELDMITPGQVDKAIAIRLGEMEPYENEVMRFGTARHKQFEAWGKEHGTLPTCFYELSGLKGITLDGVERELVVEMAPGYVVHSRPDAYSISDSTLFDFKTAVDGKRGWQENVKKYKYSRQGLFYALMLGYHGIEIKTVKYLCEIWNADYDEIIGYDLVEQEVTPEKLEKVREWAIDRLALLGEALEEAKALREPAHAA